MAGLILDLGAKHDDDPYDSEDYYDYDTCHDSHEMQITLCPKTNMSDGIVARVIPPRGTSYGHPKA